MQARSRSHVSHNLGRALLDQRGIKSAAHTERPCIDQGGLAEWCLSENSQGGWGCKSDAMEAKAEVYSDPDQEVRMYRIRLVVMPALVLFCTPGMAQNPSSTRAVIDKFNEAFNRHDADALASVLTDDTVFEDTSPAPDGRRVEGKAAVVSFWRTWFQQNADARFDAEDVIVSGDRAVVLWVYHKMRNGVPWHLRGVDVFTVRDGKVAAKLAYVKG